MYICAQYVGTYMYTHIGEHANLRVPPPCKQAVKWRGIIYVQNMIAMYVYLMQ